MNGRFFVSFEVHTPVQDLKIDKNTGIATKNGKFSLLSIIIREVLNNFT